MIAERCSSCRMTAPLYAAPGSECSLLLHPFFSNTACRPARAYLAV
ncbi:MAG TPA: hypothetical protein P5536_02855 [Methanoregulaceae archaeon]|nr:MAG: hypothetical protein IPI71_09125 [Methanolinea sp.]HON82205.1 hypothetical protein [Methanoregulaceae archaeon]HRT14997.1 hypothetical protein [Methanoregulaceae archaeon]